MPTQRAVCPVDAGPDRSFASDTDKWEAVCRRDPAGDDRFFFAVRTTGVYCRPSCAARRPLRANVHFYGTAAEAERAGFRPCKRCRPDLPPRAQREAALVAAACRTIEAADPVPPLAELATQAGLSPAHFHRLFKRVVGVTPKAYAQAQRSARVREALKSGASVTEGLYRAGFNTASRFYEAAPTVLGMTPGRFRAGGEGEPIRYALSRCTLGAVLVAATERGLCAILLGDEVDSLPAKLRAQFPQAHLREADEPFVEWVAQVVRLLDDPAVGIELPLDIRATAFQRRAWEALRQIPVGETVSYGELAGRLGEPNAARAVARACAANPLAVAIPCHRVVRSDGALSGYRWGVERKRRLLERERDGVAKPRGGVSAGPGDE